jgi:hypothetical protein
MTKRKRKRFIPQGDFNPEIERNFPEENRQALCLKIAKRTFGRHAWNKSTAMFIKSRDRNRWAVFHMPCYGHYYFVTELEDKRVIEVSVDKGDGFRPLQFATSDLLNKAIDDPDQQVTISEYANKTWWLNGWMNASHLS